MDTKTVTQIEVNGQTPLLLVKEKAGMRIPINRKLSFSALAFIIISASPLLPLANAADPVPPAKTAPSPQKNSPVLWDIYKTLSAKEFVDLTHAFRSGIPKWKGYPDEKRKTIYEYRSDGFWAEQYTIVGQWGTHADPPAHFHQGLRTLDKIPVKEMVAPLVLIDISEKAQKNADTVLSVDDVKKWETKHGKVPEGAFVVCKTGWSLKWPDLDLMQNRDAKGIMHYPGWSVEALKFLIQERYIIAIGHETTDTDPGFNVSADRYPAQAYVHGENRYQIELLDNLDRVPEYGALAIVTFPKPENGSGFPARVFAILP